MRGAIESARTFAVSDLTALPPNEVFHFGNLDGDAEPAPVARN